MALNFIVNADDFEDDDKNESKVVDNDDNEWPFEFDSKPPPIFTDETKVILTPVLDDDDDLDNDDWRVNDDEPLSDWDNGGEGNDSIIILSDVIDDDNDDDITTNFDYLISDLKCYIMLFLTHNEVMNVRIISQKFGVMTKKAASFDKICINNPKYFLKWFKKPWYKNIQSIYISFNNDTEHYPLEMLQFNENKLYIINNLTKLQIITISLRGITNYHSNSLFIASLHQIIQNNKKKTIIFEGEYVPGHFYWNELILAKCDAKILQQIEKIIFKLGRYQIARQILRNVFMNYNVENMKEVYLWLELHEKDEFDLSLFTNIVEKVEICHLTLVDKANDNIFNWNQFMCNIREMPNQPTSLTIALSIEDPQFRILQNIMLFPNINNIKYPVWWFTHPIIKDDYLPNMKKNGMNSLRIIYEIFTKESLLITHDLRIEIEKKLAKFVQDIDWIGTLQWRRCGSSMYRITIKLC